MAKKKEKEVPFLDSNRASIFRSYFDRGPGCWEWKGGRKKKGNPYGIFNFPGNAGLLAHRVSWFLHTGIQPMGMCVIHTCDNPPCVNPKHLVLGTHQDNMTDKAKKARGAKKLSPDTVKKIKSLIGKIPARDIALMFGVHRTGIYKIKDGEIWGSF